MNLTTETKLKIKYSGEEDIYTSETEEPFEFAQRTIEQFDKIEEVENLEGVELDIDVIQKEE